MPKMNIVLIHGIGINNSGYSTALVEGVKGEFNAILQKKFQDKQDRSDQIESVEILWDDILDKHQRLLAERLKAGFDALPKNIFGKILDTILFLPKKGINSLRTNFSARFIGDLIAYRNEFVYQSIQERISIGIEKFSDVTSKNNISFIAHSLGTVIASDYVYDRQTSLGSLHQGLELNDFFTMASPIALFALRYGVEAFQSPIRMEHPHGRWFNIFDRDDPIAFPLKTLNDAYHKAIEADVEVDTGMFGLAHVRYWNSPKVFRVIATRLAERWQELNEIILDKG